MEANTESSLVDQTYRAAQILTRPNITLDKLSEIDLSKKKQMNDTMKNKRTSRNQYQIQRLYLKKERDNVAKLLRFRNHQNSR